MAEEETRYGVHAHCTVYRCGTALEFSISQAEEERIDQIYAEMITKSGWKRDTWGLLCPDHLDQALLRQQEG